MLLLIIDQMFVLDISSRIILICQLRLTLNQCQHLRFRVLDIIVHQESLEHDHWTISV